MTSETITAVDMIVLTLLAVYTLPLFIIKDR